MRRQAETRAVLEAMPRSDKAVVRVETVVRVRGDVHAVVSAGEVVDIDFAADVVGKG